MIKQVFIFHLNELRIWILICDDQDEVEHSWVPKYSADELVISSSSYQLLDIDRAKIQKDILERFNRNFTAI